MCKRTRIVHFCTPVLDTGHLDGELITSWLGTHITLQDWLEFFANVAERPRVELDSNPLRGINVSVEEFKRMVEVAVRDLDLKYPSKTQEFEKEKTTIFYRPFKNSIQ